MQVAKQYFSSKDQLLTLGYAPPGPEFTPFEMAKGALGTGARTWTRI